MMERLSRRHVVLLGIGHTNAHVLRMWRMNPIPDTDLTCISDFSIATYSGMLPALLAGQITRAQMEIDLVRLCSSAGARLIIDRVTGINHAENQIAFADRPPVPFDVLSVGIGSTAGMDGVNIEGESLIMIKPMQSFMSRLREAIARVMQTTDRDDLRIAVVGGGVAGIEITFCLPAFIASVCNRALSLQLVTRSQRVLPEAHERTRRLVTKELDQRGVQLLTGRSVSRVTPHRICLDDGAEHDADLVIWAASAVAPKLLAELRLDLDERGFVATDQHLRCLSSAHIFAVGDSGTIVKSPTPKAGVYAVRQGPVLWNNIRRSLDGVPLERYKPQRSFLKLINLGDGRAIGQWKGLAFSGRWMMGLKDWIDRRFMDKFQVTPMSSDGSMGAESPDEMQCRGCGCKLGSDVLQSALASVASVPLEDAAEIGGDIGRPLLASTDFFSSPVDDAYLTGRIAALHSASDLVASGCSVSEALANVVLPEGDRQSQRQALQDILRGARHEFDAMGASIVGGHTIVGPRMEIGFTVIGRPLGTKVVRKSNLHPGDQLYLSKPIGIGVLLAAQMRSMCPATAYESLLEAMLQQQHTLAQIVADVGIDAGTDVTGFGLAGHLVEMLTESKVAAEVSLHDVPILHGVVELVEEGVESSLAPDNRRAESSIAASEAIRERAEFKVLFDPQTCGGLLLGVAADQEAGLLREVSSAGLPEPVWIGRVVDRNRHPKPLTIE
jgi:selenide,water dikinase